MRRFRGPAACRALGAPALSAAIAARVTTNVRKLIVGPKYTCVRDWCPQFALWLLPVPRNAAYNLRGSGERKEARRQRWSPSLHGKKQKLSHAGRPAVGELGGVPD